MAVTIAKISRARSEAIKFIDIAERAMERLMRDKHACPQIGCKETGAVRRASMDLTRILVELRRAD